MFLSPDTVTSSYWPAGHIVQYRYLNMFSSTTDRHVMTLQPVRPYWTVHNWQFWWNFWTSGWPKCI